MNNTLKRLLSAVMAVAMVMSFAVMPVSAEGDSSLCEICQQENCQQTHVYCETCAKYDCGQTHEAVICEVCQQENCQQTHVYCETCEKYDCGETHETVTCDGTAQCEAETHDTGCLKVTCVCTVKCNEMAAETCVVCGADLNNCTGKTAEEIEAEQKAAADAAKIAEVNALIDALPETVTAENYNDVMTQLSAIMANQATMGDLWNQLNLEKLNAVILMTQTPGDPVDDVIDTIAELQAAVAAQAGATIEVTTILNNTSDAVLDLNSCTVKVKSIYNSGNLTVKNGTLVGTDKDESVIETTAGSLILENLTAQGPRHAIRVKGGSVTINSGTYSSGTASDMTTHAVNASAGTVTINGGTFRGAFLTGAESGTTVLAQGSAKVTILGGNFSGASDGYGREPVTAITSGGASISIQGGTFDKDPSAYLADDVEYDADTGKVSEKVYPVNVTTAGGVTSGYDTLAAAVAACTGGETITLADSENAYTLPASIPVAVTIKGTTKEGTIINFGEAGNQSIASVTDITFENLTINKGNADYRGFYESNSETYNNCIINGELWTYANRASFTGCEFNQTVTGWDYNIWTYAARTLSFTNCTFNSVGKAMNVYNEGYCANDITITNCKFIATQAQGKAAIEIGTSLMPSGTTVKIDAATTETGFVAGNYSGNSLWNEKTNTKTGISILVGTEQVWPVYAVTVIDSTGEKTGYQSLDAALNYAKDLTGEVTVEINGKVEYTNSTPNLGGSYSSISFIGKSDDAEISITRNGSNGYISGSGSAPAVNFANLILSKPAGNYASDAGFMNVAFSVYRTGNVTYTNCSFPNGACAAGPKTTYTSCTFQKSHDKYALWAYGADVTVNGCIFDDDRGIKMYDENKGSNNTTVLTVTNSNFSKLTSKPAIVLTLGKSVTLSGNTYSSTGVFELEDNGSSNGTTVNADLKDIACKSDTMADCGVLVDGKIYKTVTDAETAGVIGANSTITLFYNCSKPAEHVEVPVNVKVITNGYDASGIIVPKEAAYIAETGNKYATVTEAMSAAAALGNNENAPYATVVLTDLAQDGEYDVAGNTTVELNGTSICMLEGGELKLDQDGISSFTPDIANGTDGVVVIEGVGYALVNGASVTVDENGNWEIVGNYYQIATSNTLIFKPDQNHHKYYDPDMTVECSRFLKDCTGIYITGKEYGENNQLWIYNPLTRAANTQIKVEPNVNGGIKVTLPTSYLNARNGSYKIHFLFGAEDVSGDFTVYETPVYVADTSNPKTGDAIFAPAMVLLFSASALAVLLLGKKKHA